ncbi:hypothetical protein [Staphylococcus hominis]|uniref:hypothetical protein n=1 Tax=Staphylococcus hominis TaxID=1290 RepID=UPI001304F266|nr:hypothetical protein [Staphylococcus hominis]
MSELYEYNPGRISEEELAAMGVEGFVIRMTNVHVTMRVLKENKIINRKCLKDGSSRK